MLSWSHSLWSQLHHHYLWPLSIYLIPPATVTMLIFHLEIQTAYHWTSCFPSNALWLCPILLIQWFYLPCSSVLLFCMYVAFHLLPFWILFLLKHISNHLEFYPDKCVTITHSFPVFIVFWYSVSKGLSSSTLIPFSSLGCKLSGPGDLLEFSSDILFLPSSGLMVCCFNSLSIPFLWIKGISSVFHE